MDKEPTVLKKEKINKIVKNFIDNFKDVQLDIMFVQKTTGKSRYKTYMLECNKNDMKDMVNGTLSKIVDALGKRDLVEYDLELSQDDTIQYVPSSNVIHTHEVLSQITTTLNDKNTLNSDVKFDNLDFLVVQLYIPNIEHCKITLLKRHMRTPSTLKKKAVKLSFVGKEYKVISNSVLSIGDNIESFMIDDYHYIINRNSFNSMMDYKDVFHKIIDENVPAIVGTGVFTDAEGFVNGCKSNGRYLPRLTKAILQNSFGNIMAHKDNISKVKSEYGLTVKVTPNNEIVYERPEDIPEILNLLLEHYVTSALTENKMLAKAIENYLIG